MSKCPICVENFTKSKRKEIICKCGFSACKACVKMYILTKVEDAHCMTCKMPWTHKFIYDNLEYSFVNSEYKKHRENILFDRELNLLQATQPYVEREIKIEEIKNTITELDINFKQIEKEFLLKKNEYLKDKLKNKTRLDQIILNIQHIHNTQFVQKCTNNDCHGYLDESYKCGICQYYSCNKCHEVIDTDIVALQHHECNPDILQSIQLLESDSRPCTKCGIMISKVNGCDTIFCVNCHTAWNWKTGGLITRNIHNPHYSEYLASQNNGIVPRNPLDILCGREIDNSFLSAFVRKFSMKLKIEQDFVDIARNIIILRYEKLPRFYVDDDTTYNQQLRIDYMRKKIDIDTFKSIIQRKEKDYQKKKDIFDLLIMYINCMTDIFYRILDDTFDHEIYVNMVNAKREMIALKEYTNEYLTYIARTYHTRYYFLDYHFEFI